MPLVLEVKRNGDWAKAFSVDLTEQPGSLSNNASGQREMYMFQVLPTKSMIYRSRGGLDTETASGDRIVAVRGGLDVVAELKPGQDHEFDLQTDAMPSAVRARFRQE